MLVSGLVLGLAAGLAIGRDWRPLASVSIRWLPLLLAALVARAVAPFAGPLAFPLYAAALFGTAAAAAANTRLLGAALIAAGGALNLAVVLLNGGMPVDPGAVAAAGGAMPADRLHVLMTPQTLLAPLADVVAVAPLHAAYSPGDFAVALGGFLVPFVLLIRR